MDSGLVDIDNILNKWFREDEESSQSLQSGRFVLDLSQVTLDVLSIDYETVNPLYQPKFIGKDKYSNIGTIDDDYTFSVGSEIRRTYELSFTEGLKISVGAKFKAGLPFVGEAEAQLSVEGSFSSTQKWADSDSEDWRRNIKARVPAGTKVVLKMYLKEAEYNPHFTAQVRIGGNVTLGPTPDYDAQLQEKAERHPNTAYGYIPFMPVSITDILKQSASSSKFTFKEENGQTFAYYTARGMFKGVRGVSADIIKEEYALGAEEIPENVRVKKPLPVTD